MKTYLAVVIILALSSVVAPAFAKGGGSDIQAEREKIFAEAKAPKTGISDKEKTRPSVSFFELIFGGKNTPDTEAQQ